MASLPEPITLTQLEILERTQKLSIDQYVRMVLALLQEQSPISVKDVWERLPDEFKGNALLASLNGVADSLNEKHFTKVHAQWKLIAFSPALNDIALEVSKRLRFFGLEHIRRVYTIITVERFATLTGLQDDLSAAVTYAVESGCSYNSTKRLISVPPLLPDESVEDGDWPADLEGLGMIGDTIWALSRQPNPTNDSIVRKMHEY